MNESSTTEDSGTLKPTLRTWSARLAMVGLALIAGAVLYRFAVPAETRWSETDATEHSELAAKYHEAFHASATAKKTRAPTASEAAAKQKWIAERFAASEARLERARFAQDEFQPGLWYGGIALTILGLGGWLATSESDK